MAKNNNKKPATRLNRGATKASMIESPSATVPPRAGKRTASRKAPPESTLSPKAEKQMAELRQLYEKLSTNLEQHGAQVQELSTNVALNTTVFSNLVGQQAEVLQIAHKQREDDSEGDESGSGSDSDSEGGKSNPSSKRRKRTQGTKRINVNFEMHPVGDAAPTQQTPLAQPRGLTIEEETYARSLNDPDVNAALQDYDQAVVAGPAQAPTSPAQVEGCAKSAQTLAALVAGKNPSPQELKAVITSVKLVLKLLEEPDKFKDESLAKTHKAHAISVEKLAKEVRTRVDKKQRANKAEKRREDIARKKEQKLALRVAAQKAERVRVENWHQDTRTAIGTLGLLNSALLLLVTYHGRVPEPPEKIPRTNELLTKVADLLDSPELGPDEAIDWMQSLKNAIGALSQAFCEFAQVHTAQAAEKSYRPDKGAFLIAWLPLTCPKNEQNPKVLNATKEFSALFQAIWGLVVEIRNDVEEDFVLADVHKTFTVQVHPDKPVLEADPQTIFSELDIFGAERDDLLKAKAQQAAVARELKKQQERIAEPDALQTAPAAGVPLKGGVKSAGGGAKRTHDLSKETVESGDSDTDTDSEAEDNHYEAMETDKYLPKLPEPFETTNKPEDGNEGCGLPLPDGYTDEVPEDAVFCTCANPAKAYHCEEKRRFTCGPCTCNDCDW
tara:strand:- start:537 stop:2546 length:2010 start_codon:yes stop_codon:yes gene_type:complete